MPQQIGFQIMRSSLLTRSYTVDSVKLTFRRFFSIVERRTAEFQLIIEGKAYTLTSRLTNACAE